MSSMKLCTNGHAPLPRFGVRVCQLHAAQRARNEQSSARHATCFILAPGEIDHRIVQSQANSELRYICACNHDAEVWQASLEGAVRY